MQITTNVFFSLIASVATFLSFYVVFRSVEITWDTSRRRQFKSDLPNTETWLFGGFFLWATAVRRYDRSEDLTLWFPVIALGGVLGTFIWWVVKNAFRKCPKDLKDLE